MTRVVLSSRQCWPPWRRTAKSQSRRSMPCRRTSRSTNYFRTCPSRPQRAWLIARRRIFVLLRHLLRVSRLLEPLCRRIRPVGAVVLAAPRTKRGEDRRSRRETGAARVAARVALLARSLGAAARARPGAGHERARRERKRGDDSEPTGPTPHAISRRRRSSWPAPAGAANQTHATIARPPVGANPRLQCEMRRGAGVWRPGRRPMQVVEARDRAACASPSARR